MSQGDSIPEGTSYPSFWLTIRHVCQLWRNIALSVPQLSSWIVTTHPECVEDMLHLSGNSSLHLISAPQSADIAHSFAAYSCALAQSHRFTRATFRLSRELMMTLPWAVPIETIDLSALEQLNIGLPDRHYTTRYRRLLTDITFPALRCFALRGGDIQFCRSVLSAQLQHLSLRFLYRLSPHQLATSLEGLQNLNTLVIQDMLLGDDHDDLNSAAWIPQQHIIFPSLRRLSVTDAHPGSLFRFFAHIVYPADTHVTVGDRFVAPLLPSSVISETLLPKLCGATLLGSMPIIRRVTVEVDDRLSTRHSVKAWAAPLGHAGEQSALHPMQLEPLLELVVYSPMDLKDAITEVMSGLSLSTVTDLHISDAVLSRHAWKALPRVLPALQTVSVVGTGPALALPGVLPQPGLAHLRSLRYDLSWAETPFRPFNDLVGALIQHNSRREGPLEALTVVLSPEHYVSTALREKIENLSHGVVRSIRFASAANGLWLTSKN